MGIKELFFSPSLKGWIHPRDPFWDGRKKGFAIAVASTFILIQLLFLGNLSYLNGALWKDGEKVHNMNILLVDYDQGLIGQSLRSAYDSLKADSFPSFYEHNATEHVDPAAVEHAVYVGEYWGAIYTHAGASDRLAAALAGGEAAANYNSSDTITYVLNSARYPTTFQGYVLANFETLVAVARIVYNNINGTQALKSLANDRNAALALLNPIAASTIDIKPTTQGPRVIYNTISMVFPIIMQFFFLMGVNGISNMFQVYSHLPLLNNGLLRLGLSASYTFIGSLCTSGYIYAFRESWEISAGQFFLVWMVFWLYMHINFLVMDCATGFIPMSFVSFFMLTWVVFNVTSTILPFELNPGFYRWGYALPAHNAYQILVQIWSGGGYQHLYQALPILFAWEIGTAPLVVLAMHKRCEAAAVEAQKAEEANKNTAARIPAKAEIADDITETGTRDNSVSTAVPSQAARRSTVVSDAAPMERRQSGQYFPNTPIPFENTLAKVGSIARRHSQSGAV